MSSIEALKADYLAQYQMVFPRLKELAMAIRREEAKLTGEPEIEAFWQITDNPKTNYELSQLALDLEESEDFWQSHPDNPELNGELS